MLNTLLLITNLIGFVVSGTVKDQNSGAPVQSARISLENTPFTVETDSLGHFYMIDVPAGNYYLKIEHNGLEVYGRKIDVTDSDVFMEIFTQSMPEQVTEEIIITGIRAQEKYPVTQFNMSRKEIGEKYYGHDIPYLLNNSPAVYSYSESGIGIGYSYLRIRGLDQTRINMTVNGIPINDPETQGFYFNNFADLAKSAESIQVQRGVGTSTNGTASFGGSININSVDLSPVPSFELNTGYGSYDSKRISAEYHTGLIKNKVSFYGRLSSISTDGYRTHSGSDIKSYFLSGAYFGKKSILKFNAFGGLAQSQLAYLATESSVLDTNRKYNQLTESETDLFQQNFYQLQYSYKANQSLTLAASSYYVRGKGNFLIRFYDAPYTTYTSFNLPDAVIGADTLYTSNFLTDYKLKMDLYGFMAYLNYNEGRINLHSGFHANVFTSDHSQEIPWAQNFPSGVEPNHLAYFNTGYKNEISGFAKATFDISEDLLFFGDAQVRFTSFRYKGRDQAILRDTFLVEDMQWTFFNPKVGLRYYFNKKTSIYTSLGKTTREPTRLDLFSGQDRATNDIKQSDVIPETVYNLELGYEIKTERFNSSVNLFFMEFKNEIAATGQLNVFGYPLRKNVRTSFRRGLEVDVAWNFLPKFTLTHSSVFSYNRIREFEQFYDIYDEVGSPLFDSKAITGKNVNPLLTPSIMINQGLRFNPVKWISLEIIGKYVGRSFLDNTNNKDLTVPAYVFADFRASIGLNKLLKTGDHTLSFQANNITNTAFSPSGYSYNTLVRNSSGNESVLGYKYYYPAATGNYFVTLTLKF